MPTIQIPLFLCCLAFGCTADARADAVPTPQRTEQGSEAPAPASKHQQVVIPVKGMACESCAERLQSRLAGIDGVSKATVDFAKKEARLTFDPRKVSVKRLVEEIDKTFEAGKPRSEGDA